MKVDTHFSIASNADPTNTLQKDLYRIKSIGLLLQCYVSNSDSQS